MEDKIDLERILSNLSSDEARAVAISKLIGKVEISDKIIEVVIGYYIKIRKFKEAGDLAKEAGRIQEAVKYYEKAGMFDDAINLAKEAGMIEKAISIYSNIGRLREAGDLAKEAGETEWAQRLYEEKLRMISLDKREWEFLFHDENFSGGERAQWDYQSVYILGHVAYLCKETGRMKEAQRLYGRALMVYDKIGQFRLAGDLAKEAGRIQEANEYYVKAIERYERQGCFKDAAEVAKEAGMIEKAEKLKALIDLMGK